ncbi:E3 SUMO-protein ligase RanBP2-like isoform X2 [Argopecten irradians]|uniref:E3 SUMO-protein ligase RanBP2-like isoform X2 n=1 Tax=Argopecten irradians TaxID=31199 RepID=UPI003715A335
MSTTRRSKKDIDRFINQFPADQISERGYQVAVLYSEIGEYDLAKKYLSLYMRVRDDLPQAHKLMALICEGLEEKEQAIACYRRSLELDNSQKGIILKICEVLSSMPADDAQRIKYWTEKAEKLFSNNPVVFKLKEKILSSSSGTDLDKLEELYSKQLEKNYTDSSLHIKLMELYLTSDRVQAAINHGIEVERTLAFVQNPSWYKCLIKAFSAQRQREHGGDDVDIHRLFALQNLVFQMMPDHDVVACATVLHQFDQCLFELSKASSQRPKWHAVVTEMEGQIYFLSALVLFKRAQKGQVLWKDASFFATVCLLLSSQYPAIDVKSAWYLQLKQHNRKFFDRLQKIGAYRHSQGGYLVLNMTKTDTVSRLQHIKQQVKMPRAREVFYDALFTLRVMRDSKDRSYILNSDTFHKVPVVLPSKSVVAEYDKDVLHLYGDNLHVLVWQALQNYSSRDTTQPVYGMDLYAKLPYSCAVLTNGAPESLSQVDAQAFFCATVRCAAIAVEDENKHFRPDSYRPELLPACLSQPLCSKLQRDWWEAMFKFSVGTPRDSYAKLRLTLQQGLETIRLVGAHGMGLTLVTHLAQTFDKWAQMVKKTKQDDPTKCEALESRATFYWKEAMQMLRRLEKNLPYRYPKERMFVDGEQATLTKQQIADLKEQATFSLAVLDMREGRYEEAKEKFESSKRPMATFHLAQIYRTLANKIPSDSPGGKDQKKILLERSLDMLYQALDAIQGDTEHELHKEIPVTLDEVVNQLERMQMPYGTSLVDSLSINNNADSNDEESFSTPKSFHTTPGQNGTPINRSYGRTGASMEPMSLFQKESPSFVASNIIEQSTPAPQHREHVRPSPERLDARIWALEKKMATLIELQEQSKKHWERTVQDSIKNMQDDMRAEMAQNDEILKEMKEFLVSFRSSAAGRFIAPPFRPPQYYQPQQQSWMPPSNYGYQMSPVPGAPLAPYPGTMGPFPPPNRLTPQPPVAPINQMSHQNDIVEDDIYHIDGEYYEDDGSQPPPHHMYQEQQLSQEWPFGNRANLEGKSTITYTPPGPQTGAMSQPGMFANALRGQSLQYTIKQQGVAPPPPPPRLPASQPPTHPLPGPGFFSQSAMFTPQDPASRPAPSALMAVLTGSPTSDTTTSTVPSNLTTSQPQPNMAGKDSLFDGKSLSICQPQSMVSLGQTSTPGSLFPSLMAASKSPDTSDAHQSMLRGTEIPSRTKPPIQNLGASSKPLTQNLGTSSVSPSLNLGSKAPTQITGSGSTAPALTLGSKTPTQNPPTAAPTQNLASFTNNVAKSSLPTMFQHTSPSGQKSVTSPVKSPGRHDDDVMEEYEPKVDFKPIIDLPDLVEVKTGEEDEEKVFGERAKLYRYDAELNQWKERGIGEMKLLRHRTTKQVRVLMRREQVLKVCANHKITTAMKLVPMANSDRAWCWTAMDYAEGEIQTERLAVRFKTTDQAQLFKQTFEECQGDLQQQEKKAPAVKEDKKEGAKEPTTLAEMFKSGAKPATVAPPAVAPPKTNPAPAQGQSLGDLFRPEEGSWDCDGCYVNNKPGVQKCVACQALKPGLKPENVKPIAAASTISKGFSTNPAPAQGQSLGDLFRPEEGSWDCDGCYVNNKPGVQKCVACQALKPGLKPEDVKPIAAASTTSKGFSFGGPAGSVDAKGFTFGGGSSSGGFMFGKPPATSEKDTKSAPPTTAEPTSAGFSLGQSPAFSFKPMSSTSSTQPSAAGGFKFNMAAPVSSSQADSTSTSTSTSIPSSTVGKTTPGIGLDTTPVTTKSATFSVPQGGFNFSLAKTEAPQKTESPAIQSPFKLNSADSKPSGFSFKAEPKTPESKSSAISSEFKFTFTPSAAPATVINSPKSPDTSEYYQNKDGEDDHIHFEPIVSLPEAVAVVTGEENDEILYEHRAKLYRFDKQEWKERGLGNVKILHNSESGKCRLLMRRDQIHKVCCHHYITQDLELKPMPKTDGKALVWFAMDFSDENPSMENFSIRFKTAEIANNFSDAFVKAQEKSKDSAAKRKSSPAAGVSAETKSSPGESDDVVFVSEVKATEEQIAQARKYLLPDNFYLYLTCKPCPGCRGCTDSMPGEPYEGNSTKSIPTKSSSVPTSKGIPQTTAVFGSASSSPGKVFGTSSGTFSTPTTGGLFSSLPSSKAPATGGLFGAPPTTLGGGIFGSQTSASSSGGLFGSQTASSSSSGGLFGSQMTSSSSGLFGSQPSSSSSSGGLFGSQTASSSSSGGIFGSESSAPSSSGLFGSESSAPSSGGIFGSESSAHSSSGLFGSTTPSSSTGGLFSSSSQTSTLFGSKPATPVSETPKDSVNQTVSPGGTVFGGQSSAVGQFSFSQLASQTGSEAAFKKDDSKPFSWSGAGKQLFGAKGQDGGSQDADENDESLDAHDPHFEPIVALPDLVEIKTGEEDFDALFSMRAKLYRFDKQVNQWKEKGIGEMKVLQQHHTGKIRLLLRREQIFKLACNHWLTPDHSFKPMSTSEMAWCWTAQDYSEEEARMEQLAVKFKNIDIATQFKQIIDECQVKLKDMATKSHDKIPIQVSEVTSVECSDAVQSEEDDEDDSDDDESDENDDDDTEVILFEKRATLLVKENDWKILGMGQLKVEYDDDVNGNRIVMDTDDKKTVCNHLLTKESVLRVNRKQKNCEWSPIDFSTDDPVRREFRAQFSSEMVLEEFQSFFEQGQKLAVDSDLSERHMITTHPREIVHPEVHAHSAGAED